MRALAEISLGSTADLQGGTLRRRELDAFDALLGKLRGGSTVLVTGAAQGKRATAVGLATAAAAEGKRTALLECDLAEPGLAGPLRLAPRPGLHEYLRGESHVGEILQALVLAGPGSARTTDPLVCIVAGRPTPDGESLLASESFGHAMQALHEAYEMVVLDGPGLVPDMAQLGMVAVHADLALACVARSDARRDSRRLRRNMRRLPTRFAGLVAFD